MDRKIVTTFLIVFLAVLAGYKAFFRMGLRVRTGGPAPEFAVQDLSGQTVSLASYRGKKIVLLDFWATWCGPCQMAMPDFQRWHTEYHDRGLEVLGVNQGESAAEVRAFIQRNKYTFHFVLDQD